ncbi:MAG: hypothetical protein HKN26_12085 [Acidimicrobiales bacterium]|nr:hypothetical protein [Acidimicrobiales bacterium]
MADLKDHAADHGFHIHDERHFVETYSMRQAFEVDFHPADACGGPLDLHLAVDLDPRVLLAFEDEVITVGPDGRPSNDLSIPVLFTWGLPPLAESPDLLVLATELAGIGGADLPLEVSAADIVGALSVSGEPKRSLTIVAKAELTLASIFLGEEQLCDVLDTCYKVSEFILHRAPEWVGDWQPDQ